MFEGHLEHDMYVANCLELPLETHALQQLAAPVEAAQPAGWGRAMQQFSMILLKQHETQGLWLVSVAHRPKMSIS